MMKQAKTFRCGECFASLPDPQSVHECERLPLSTARVSEVVWHYLIEPDEQDLLYATYEVYQGKRLLEPCPFCGSKAGPPTTKVRVDNGMFQTTVRCARDTRCGAEVFWNGFSKRDAHAGAVGRWNDRRPIAERDRLTVE